MERIRFMNFEIDNISLKEAIEEIKKSIESKGKMYIVTPNVDHVVRLQDDKMFLTAYNRAGLVVVDGTPIMIVSKLYGTPLKEKVTGPRLAEETVKMASQNNFSVFFLGAGEGVGQIAAKNLLNKYPGFMLAGCYSPPFGFENDENERNKIINIVNSAAPDIIIAGMGSPKTEIFLAETYEKLGAHVSLSVGAAIDFFAGSIKRCPEWVNKIGMEWFYRFVKEPKRMFKRYFVDDIKFLKLIWQYRKNNK